MKKNSFLLFLLFLLILKVYSVDIPDKIKIFKDFPIKFSNKKIQADYYVIDDLNGDKKDDLVIVFSDQSVEGPFKEQIVAYYNRANNNWKLVNIVHDRIRGAITNNPKNPFNINGYWPFPKVKDSKMLSSFNLDNIKGDEIICPVVGFTYNGIVIYGIKNNKLILLKEIEGFEDIIDINNDNKYELYGHYITDFAFLSLKDKTYYYYYFDSSNNLVKMEKIPKIIYDLLLKKKNKIFNQTKSLVDFHYCLLFQIANGDINDAKKWFKKNKKKIGDLKINNNEKYLKEIENKFIK